MGSNKGGHCGYMICILTIRLWVHLYESSFNALNLAKKKRYWTVVALLCWAFLAVTFFKRFSVDLICKFTTFYCTWLHSLKVFLKCALHSIHHESNQSHSLLLSTGTSHSGLVLLLLLTHCCSLLHPHPPSSLMHITHLWLSTPHLVIIWFGTLIWLNLI